MAKKETKKEAEPKSTEEQLKDANGMLRFYRWIFPAILVVQGLGAVQTHAIKTANESKIYGEDATWMGKTLRQAFLLSSRCNDCTTIDDLRTKPQNDDTHKAAATTLIELSKDPIGKALVDKAAARDVRFEADSKDFAQTCTASAFYNPYYGVVGYTTGGLEEKKGASELRGEVAHELFHSLQGLEGTKFTDHKKDFILQRIVAEAAAFTFGDMMEARRVALEKNPGKAIDEAKMMKQAKDAMNKFLFSDSGMLLRQVYLLKYNPTFSDYDMAPKDIDLAALKRVATLPDGRSFLPDDLTIAKLDLQVRRDLYADIVQRKPKALAAAGDAHAATAKDNTAESTAQISNKLVCAANAKKNEVYKPS